MIAEALQIVQDTAQKAAASAGKVAVVKLPGEADHYFATVDPSGALTPHVARPGPIADVIGTVAEVTEYVARVQKDLGGDPVVWISPERVEVVIHAGAEDDRRDRAIAPLTFTPQWNTLRELADSQVTIDQKALVRLLRIHLHDCLGEPGRALLRVVRAIDFASGSTGHGEINQGRESLGREVTAHVQSKHGELPETVPLAVRVYTDPAMLARRTVLCGLEVDAATHRFAFAPLPGQLDDALNDELSDLDNRISKDADCPVFLGRP